MSELACLSLFLGLSALTLGLIGILDGWIKGGEVMTSLYWVSGTVSAGLLVYLVMALLKPEWF